MLNFFSITSLSIFLSQAQLHQGQAAGRGRPVLWGLGSTGLHHDDRGSIIGLILHDQFDLQAVVVFSPLSRTKVGRS